MGNDETAKTLNDKVEKLEKAMNIPEYGRGQPSPNRYNDILPTEALSSPFLWQVRFKSQCHPLLPPHGVGWRRMDIAIGVVNVMPFW